MKNRTYDLISGALLAVVAIFHAARVFLNTPVQVGTWAAPMWVSLLGVLLAGGIAAVGFSLAHKCKTATPH
jgi:uncharacterized integral membrane protein